MTIIGKRSEPLVFANRANWMAALLFGLLFVLLILIMSWLLRTIEPNEGAINMAMMEAPSPASLPLQPDLALTLKAALLKVEADGEQLTVQLIALNDDLKRKAEQCKPIGPPRPSSALPADRWSSKDLSVLQGCWFLGREAPTVRFDARTLKREENCTTKVGRMCFDASGHGRREQTVSCPRAGTIFCSAPVLGQFGVDGTFRTSQPIVACQSGTPTNWYSRTLSCHRVDDEHAICRDGIGPDLGLPAQDLEFRRAP
jgi:hypothetical protein